ncbi:MAG: SlyX family protein [Gammaproteobacteria bacterium]|nr:MAG: SlyX family protein [Gammaproteobacteria bacterium]
MTDIMNELIELQTRLAYQEDTIQRLNDVITQQDATILQLQQQMRLLAKRVEEFSFVREGGEETLNERPPHY